MGEIPHWPQRNQRFFKKQVACVWHQHDGVYGKGMGCQAGLINFPLQGNLDPGREKTETHLPQSERGQK